MVEDTQEPKTGTAVDSSGVETSEVDAPESEAAGADTPETPEAETPEAEVADEAPEAEAAVDAPESDEIATSDASEAAVSDADTDESVSERVWDVSLDGDPRHESEYTSDEYEELLSMYEETLSEIAEGEIVTAQVLSKTDTEVILDVGFKSEGSIPLDEFRDPDSVEPGDSVDVFLESLEDDQGVVVLSKKKADFLRVWEKIKEAYDNDEPVKGMIKRKIKGGVTVDLMGVDAFLPGSQIALRRVPNVDDLIGEEYDFKILKLNKRRRNIVVSRRVLLENERADKREILKTELEVGHLKKGVVKNITDFGAFIDLGGMDGLLHITDMSWGRIGHPSEVCDIGEEVEVKILDIDWERERISLGLKQLQEYPWKNVADKYPVGSRVHGRVVSITNYGAFVELEKGIEGLVHISEMSWTRNVRHPSQLVTISEEIECVVLRVDEDAQKISLGMKQIEEDPWLALPAKYPPGTKISGVVRNLTSFGAFVEVEPGIDGLVHISDMSWTRRVQHPAEVMRKSDEVDVVVLSIDAEQKRISLGLKQVDEDPWYELAQEYQPGHEVTGRVIRLLEKGVVVDLGNDLEGFVPISQLGVEDHIDQPSDRFAEDDELELRVLETDPINRRIVLAAVGAADVEVDPSELDYSEAKPADSTSSKPADSEDAKEPEEPTAEAEAADSDETEAEPADSEDAEETEEPTAEAEAADSDETEAEEPTAEAEVADSDEADAPADEAPAEVDAEATTEEVDDEPDDAEEESDDEDTSKE
jgi:small subunit ribosomal protein S1